MFPAKRSGIIFLSLIVAVLILPSCSALNFSKNNSDQLVHSEQTGQVEKWMPIKEPNMDGGTDIDIKLSDAKRRDAKINSLEKEIALLKNKVKILESRVAGQKKVVYTMQYSDPAQLYKKARTLLLAKEVDNAADLFSTFIQKHPDHGLADNALYWLGECHYTTSQYKQAIQVFTKLVKNYPKAEKVPDALLKTGYAYISLDNITRAELYLKRVIKKHPFSQAAGKAEIKLKKLK